MQRATPATPVIPSFAPPSRERTGAGATSTRSHSCLITHDAPRAPPPRVAPDQGHASPLLPDSREGAARNDDTAKPLVERAALRRRSRTYDASPSPRRDGFEITLDFMDDALVVQTGDGRI